MKWLVGIALTGLVVTILSTTIGALVVGESTSAPSTASTARTTAAAATSGTESPARTTGPGIPTYSVEEVSTHATPDDCWLIVNARVYDVTDYLRLHPGGQRTITKWCGKESTTAFVTEDGRGEHSPAAWNDLEHYLVGQTED